MKRAGGRIALADASRMATCHMYPSWAALTDGYTKSLWASFGSAPAAAVLVVLLLALYTAPPIAALVLAVAPGVTAGLVTPALIALAAYLLGVAGRATAARATGARWWPDAFAHPISVAAFAWLVALSFHRRRQGRLTWRGRQL